MTRGGWLARAEAAELADPVHLAMLKRQAERDAATLAASVPRYPTLPMPDVLGYARAMLAEYETRKPAWER